MSVAEPGPPLTRTALTGVVELHEPLVAVALEIVTTASLPAGFSKT